MVSHAVVILVLGTAFSGCSEKPRPPTNPNRREQVDPLSGDLRSTVQVRQLLAGVMNTNQVMSVVGRPRWREMLAQQAEVWHYNVKPFPADDAVRGMDVTGFSTMFTNARLAFLSFDYAPMPAPALVRRHEALLGSSEAQLKVPRLELSIISKDPVVDGRFVDTELVPKAGFIGPAPELAIEKVKEVTLYEQPVIDHQQRGATNWSFVIVLTEEDAGRFRSLTASNLNRQMLFSVGGEPVVSAKIVMTILNGVLNVQLPDRKAMKVLKASLATMGARWGEETQ